VSPFVELLVGVSRVGIDSTGLLGHTQSSLPAPGFGFVTQAGAGFDVAVSRRVGLRAQVSVPLRVPFEAGAPFDSYPTTTTARVSLGLIVNSGPR
jgi:hypothetical protein